MAALSRKGGYAPQRMYCPTYRLLAQLFREDCVWLRENVGVSFRSCSEGGGGVVAGGGEEGVHSGTTSGQAIKPARPLPCIQPPEEWDPAAGDF